MNIIFIMVDQLAAGLMNCYGGVVDSTPNINKLAAQGTIFNRCYASCPICAPNRATILTGRSPEIHGVITNNYVLTTDTPTYAHVLQRRGYHTGGFGKFHQTPMCKPHPESLDYLGFNESAICEDPKWGDWINWVKEEYPQHLDAALAMAWGSCPEESAISDELNQRKEKAHQEIMIPIWERSPWGLIWKSPLPAECHDTTFIANLGIDFMKRHLQRETEQPFFCHMSFVDPHDPYNPPEPYASMFSPEEMPLPIPPAWMENASSRLHEEFKSCLGIDKVWDKPEVMKEMLAMFHGELKFLDDQIGRVIDFVKEQGIWDDTIIVFTSDHGELLGDHAFITKGIKHYDKGIRCPLIVAGGNTVPQESNKLICSLDFFPTFCDWAGVPIEDRPPVEGKSFVNTCCGEEADDLWAQVTVAYADAVSIITDDSWRLTRYVDHDEGQMFNLNTDPNEQNNLYNDNDFADKKMILLERLCKASTRSHRTIQYKNMPREKDRKCMPRGVCESLVPKSLNYQLKTAPFL